MVAVLHKLCMVRIHWLYYIQLLFQQVRILLVMLKKKTKQLKILDQQIHDKIKQQNQKHQVQANKHHKYVEFKEGDLV